VPARAGCDSVWIRLKPEIAAQELLREIWPHGTVDFGQDFTLSLILHAPNALKVTLEAALLTAVALL
jgi:hypothetical protein